MVFRANYPKAGEYALRHGQRVLRQKRTTPSEYVPVHGEQSMPEKPVGASTGRPKGPGATDCCSGRLLAPSRWGSTTPGAPSAAGSWQGNFVSLTGVFRKGGSFHPTKF